MQLPFSQGAFFDLFATYNHAWWPVALGLWLATLIALVARVAGREGSEWTFALLAAQWGWAGVAYHASLFTQINPAAWFFAALFVIQAGLLLWYGVVQRRLELSTGSVIFRVLGYALVAYGLIYPLLAVLSGHPYPRVPTFGVPCPVTLVSVGFLLLVGEPIPVAVAVVPVLWTVIAGSAAFMLGVYPDLMLFVAGALLVARVSTKATAMA